MATAVAACGTFSARLAGITEKQLTESSTLFLKSRSLNDDDCAAIAPFLAKNKALREIYIGFNSFGDEGARQLCSGLTQAVAEGQRLHLLGFRRCRLGDGAAKAVADLIRSAPSIDEIGLDENEIGDEGARALAEALAEIGAGGSPALRSLYLGENAITEEGKALVLKAAPPSVNVIFRRG